MRSEALLSQAVTVRIEGWRVVEGALLIRAVGSPEERELVCDRCRRRHWILETHSRDGGTFLAVKCHGCGARDSLALAVASD